MFAFLSFPSRNADPCPLELDLWFSFWRGISKGRSNWTADGEISTGSRLHANNFAASSQ